MSPRKVAWVGADWGTSQLRLWLIDGSGQVIARRNSNQGMGGLTADAFEGVLLGELADVLDAGSSLNVICCGMVGSRQGWQEAPYLKTPCAPPTLRDAVRVQGSDARLSVFLLPGVSQMAPADVMRGEETQIAGLLALEPSFDGVACLPGTHTKWVQISAGEIVSFRTYMTGELFGLLSNQSVLRHSLGGGGWDQTAFDDAVSRALSRPAGVAADLFAIRAESLLQNLPADAARSRLSGLLIGIELAAARPYWLGQDVRILGAESVAQAYLAALTAQGVPAQRLNAEAATLRGLSAAYQDLTRSQTV